MNTYRIGLKGENKAAEYVEKNGISIISRNYRSRKGEIDLIGTDGPVIIFFEVKTISSNDFDTIEYLIDRKKQERIIMVAREFLFKNKKYNSMLIRFDILYINNEKDEIRHIKNAFFEGGVA